MIGEINKLKHRINQEMNYQKHNNYNQLNNKKNDIRLIFISYNFIKI